MRGRNDLMPHLMYTTQWCRKTRQVIFTVYSTGLEIHLHKMTFDVKCSWGGLCCLQRYKSCVLYLLTYLLYHKLLRPVASCFFSIKLQSENTHFASNRSKLGFKRHLCRDRDQGSGGLETKKTRSKIETQGLKDWDRDYENWVLRPRPRSWELWSHHSHTN